MPKDRPTQKAPQNRKQAVPQIPPTMIQGFVNDIELEVAPSPLGDLTRMRCAVTGGRITLAFPVAFTPKVIEAMQAFHDAYERGDFKPDDDAEATAAESDLHVVENKLILP